MLKKLSAFSRSANVTGVNAESIFSKPREKAQKPVLSRIANRQAAGADSDIDYPGTTSPTGRQPAKFRPTPDVPVTVMKRSS